MNKPVKSVGIVGGGTAGYLTALALRKNLPHLDVTLIESSAVPVIGVGEATTPLMPQFLHVDLGLEIAEFFAQVQPTLKLGIRFDWGDIPPGFFNYPFGQLSLADSLAHEGHILNCSFRSMLMTASRVPMAISSKGKVISGLDQMVAYHLENQRFVGYLKSQAERSGMALVDARIVEVEVEGERDGVAALHDEYGRSFCFDLYVDCSGFRSLLMGKALGSGFLDYSASLFTDSALIAAAAHRGEVRPYTKAETMDAGWCWTTLLPDEDHCGYVFSSAFLSVDEAAAEMRQRLPSMGTPRLIRFRSGRRRHFWKANVVAMGNAYAFVEPLESTALHMLIRQIGVLFSALRNPQRPPSSRAAVSRRVAAWWDYLSWFLALHFKFNRRLTTPFWKACADQIDISRHAELLDAFRHSGKVTWESDSSRCYPDPLWGPQGVEVMLRGQGVEGPPLPPSTPSESWRRWIEKCAQVVERSEHQLDMLELIDSRPEVLDRWLGHFQRVGPAFSATTGSAAIGLDSRPNGD